MNCRPGTIPRLIVWSVLLCLVPATQASHADKRKDPSRGPLGRWPRFAPIGYIKAPHPNNPSRQIHLYGDWGAIVGEEFLFIQGGKLKLLYHSFHATHMTERPLASSFLSGWALGYDPRTKVRLTPLARPGGPRPGSAWSHTDTPAYILHPRTGEHLLYNTVRPGTKNANPAWVKLPGSEDSIQVAVSTKAPAMGMPFTQSYKNALIAELVWEKGWNQNGEIKGGLSEPSPVWVPHLGKVRLFYRGLHGAIGAAWNWRVSYADSKDGKSGWVKRKVPCFDPRDPENPAWRWTRPPPRGFGFRGSWQAHFTGDPRADGVHMVCCVSNQNYARGGALAYYWSPDWGTTWIGHPDNPILIPGTHEEGVPATGFQRTPTLAIDEKHKRYILAYNAGISVTVRHKRATWIAVAPRP